jgi:phospholipid/cholesterol/gamma-HCH transport system ATP-binding protein
MSNAAIQVLDVTKRFGKQTVLDKIRLDVIEGQTLVILGGSGSGKSTLLRLMIGNIPYEEGDIVSMGKSIIKMSPPELAEYRKSIGVLFQSGALFNSMSVADNVALPLREHTGMTDAEVRARVAERLEWVGLKGVEDMRTASLSGGMKKRVGLARAIAMDPQYVLYDEPTTGLDPIMADVIDKLIRSLQQRMGVTSVVVTHDMSSAFKVADRMALLNDGRVVFLGSVEDVRTTQDPLVRQFVEGSSEGPIRPV